MIIYYILSLVVNLMAIDKSEEYNIIKGNYEFGKKYSKKISRLTGRIWYYIDRFAAAIHSVLVEIAWTVCHYNIGLGTMKRGEPI